jgi:histidinol-phosphate aminotransferase
MKNNMGVEVRKDLRAFKPYVAEEFKGLRMDTNTNIIEENPTILRALKTKKFALNYYPSSNSDYLRNALAKELKICNDNIIVGNGSDEILDFIMRAYLEPGDRVAIPVPSFVMYKIYAKLNFANLIEIPLLNNWELDRNKIINSNAKIIIIGYPNNPTGNCFYKSDILRIIDSVKGIVVLDEAYAEYSNKTMLTYIKKYDNLVITRTFSKAYGIAGLRVGYGIAQENIIRELNKIKPPYNLNLVSELLAIEALKSKRWVNKIVRITITEREKLSKELEKLGFFVYHSDSNFILANSSIKSERLCLELKKKGILIKDFSSQKLLENCVRITIGRQEDNERLIQAITKILK